MPGKNEKGNLVLQASYKDKGANGMPAQTAEQVLVLRNPLVALGSATANPKALRSSKWVPSPIRSSL